MLPTSRRPRAPFLSSRRRHTRYWRDWSSDVCSSDLTNGTRMDLARQALAQGLGLLGPDTVAGLWRFSADLTPSTDYQELAPMSALSPPARERLRMALQELTAHPYGGTGLYSTTLAAVRHV